MTPAEVLEPAAGDAFAAAEAAPSEDALFLVVLVTAAIILATLVGLPLILGGAL